MFQNMLKGAAAFFVVGVIVGLAMPAIAGALGAAGWVGATSLVTAGIGTTALWEGIVFGMFGFLAPPFQKICGGIFGDPEAKENQQLKAKVIELQGREQMLEHAVCQTPFLVQQIVSRGPKSGTASFSAAEDTRDVTPQGPTIH